MNIKSFAKINLGIEVLGKRDDGYHEIRTLFQTIDFFDIISFHPAGHGEIHLTGSDPAIPWDEANLIFESASVLKEKHGVRGGLDISVAKNIPPGKGLGGGSSNAAVTLYALNKLWDLQLEKRELQEFGRSFGADIPFFLEGGLCLGEERGDRITPLADLAPLPCLLLLPPYPISTAEVYGRHRLPLTSGHKVSKINEFLAHKELGLLENDLEETIFRLYPRLRDLKSLFRGSEASLSLVSGTGSAVFALFLEREKAERVLIEAQKISRALLVETVPRRRYWEELTAGV